MKAKKSLGQHFLTSTSALATIIDAAQIKKGEAVLEIGPGRGVLTDALLAAGAKVVSVEKDEHLVSELETKFAKAITQKKLEIITGDILQTTPTKLGLKKYLIVANIPYYITGAIIKQFLTATNQPDRMVLLVQKEVAERIVAKDQKESLLSISVKVFGTPHYIKKVPAGAFSPPPKVDSAIISIDHISHNNFTNELTTTAFFNVVKQGFNQKRKKLGGKFKSQTEAFKICSIDHHLRAENLTVADWLCLAKNLKDK